MPSSFTNLVNQRKMEVHVGHSQVSPKARKQAMKADDSKCHHQHAAKTIEVAKVHAGQQRSENTERADVRASDDANPGWFDYNTFGLA